SLKARQTRSRRRGKEKQAPPRPPEAVAADFADLLHAELAALPGAYRAAVLLCGLEGQTLAEAGRPLGGATGTGASRLARGRSKLANRLRALGLSVSVGLIATLLNESASAAVRIAADPSPHVLTLAEEVMRTALPIPKLAALATAVVAGILTLTAV